jgi:hypothetical protein
MTKPHIIDSALDDLAATISEMWKADILSDARASQMRANLSAARTETRTLYSN